MKILKNISIRLFSVVGLCAITGAIILYNMGYYDISFIQRSSNKDDSIISEESSDTKVLDYNDEYTVVTQSGENISHAYTPNNIVGIEESKESETELETLIQPKTPTFAEMTADIPLADNLITLGWKKSDEVYSKNLFQFAKLTPNIKFNNNFNHRNKSITVITKVKSPLGGYTTKLNSVLIKRPILELYMGFIIYDEKNSYSILDTNGKKIASNYNENEIIPAYARDKNGIPLFLYKDKYYSFLSNNNIISECQYSPEIDYRGAKFDYPTYYGKSPYNIYKFKQDNVWGYQKADGTELIHPKFYKAYEFSKEGLAATVDEDGIMTFINSRGEEAITGTKEYRNANGREVKANYCIPDTNGIESLGFYHFEYGLTRVRERIVDYYYSKNVMSDVDYLIKSDGTKFNIPYGYQLEAYSNGVMLLSKDKLYGYMDYTGTWIAQPIYTFAQPFIEGVAIIGFDKGKKAMIDTSGNIVLPFVYDHISNISNGVAVAYEENNGWNIFHKLKK